MPEQRIKIEHGCGCSSFLGLVFLIGVLELAADWIGDHPAPAVLIGAALLLVAWFGYRFWRQRRSAGPPQAAVPLRAVMATPAAFCPSCGTPAGTGPYCQACGRLLPDVP
jgi:ammonia channel protein AmtB